MKFLISYIEVKLVNPLVSCVGQYGHFKVYQENRFSVKLSRVGFLCCFFFAIISIIGALTGHYPSERQLLKPASFLPLSFIIDLTVKSVQ